MGNISNKKDRKKGIKVMKRRKEGSIVLFVLAVLLTTVILTGCGPTNVVPAHIGNNIIGGSSGGENNNNGNEVGGSLPVYPGSSQTADFNMFATLIGFSSRYGEIHQYIVKGVSSDKIIKWYKQKFSDYSVASEENLSVQGISYALLTLKKGDTIVGVATIQQGEDTVYFIGKVKGVEESVEESNALPEDDTAQGDEPLKRYPGSIMLDYSRDNSGFPITYEITYGTNEDFRKVAEWYKKELGSNGWENTYDEESGDGAEMRFKKEDDEVTIYIYPPENNGNSYTEIEVYYKDESMPSHDLASGDDPLGRYPGAVMIKYKKGSITYQGQSTTGIEIEYLAPATLEKVKEWYSKKLNEKFPNGIGGSGENGEILIGMGQLNGRNVIVNVQLEEHTKYTKIGLSYVEQGP